MTKVSPGVVITEWIDDTIDKKAKNAKNKILNDMAMDNELRSNQQKVNFFDQLSIEIEEEQVKEIFSMKYTQRTKVLDKVIKTYDSTTPTENCKIDGYAIINPDNNSGWRIQNGTGCHDLQFKTLTPTAKYKSVGIKKHQMDGFTKKDGTYIPGYKNQKIFIIIAIRRSCHPDYYTGMIDYSNPRDYIFYLLHPDNFDSNIHYEDKNYYYYKIKDLQNMDDYTKEQQKLIFYKGC